MKRITCEMCGGTDLLKKEGVFECQSCGSKYTVEEARRMMVEGTVEVTGKVTVDNTAKLENLYKIARRANVDGNTKQAAKYYEQLQLEDPDNWEPNFFTAYYSGINSLINDSPGSSVQFRGGQVNLSYDYRSGISSCTTTIYNSIDSVFSLIEDIQDNDEQKAAINTVYEEVESIASILEDFIDREHQRMKGEISHFCNETVDDGRMLYKAMKKSNMGSKNDNTRDSHKQKVSSMLALVKNRKNRIEEIIAKEAERREKEYWDSLSEEERQEILRKREEEALRKREEEYDSAVKELWGLDEGLKQFEKAKGNSSVSEYKTFEFYYITLANKFDAFGNFKDAVNLSKKCRSKINFCAQKIDEINSRKNYIIFAVGVILFVFFFVILYNSLN